MHPCVRSSVAYRNHDLEDAFFTRGLNTRRPQAEHRQEDTVIVPAVHRRVFCETGQHRFRQNPQDAKKPTSRKAADADGKLRACLRWGEDFKMIGSDS